MGASRTLTLFLCGDVMTGRGIDQVLPHPSEPEIYESFVRSAGGYVALAESANGPIPRPVEPAYIWGDALDEIAARTPDWRVINLETSVTTSNRPEPKGINYRMHPGNIGCLTVAGVDCCTLANNHVLDWGVDGLVETLDTLHGAGLATTGAGRDESEALAPGVFSANGKPRLLVYAFGTPSSGVPVSWAATSRKPGINLLADLSRRTAQTTGEKILAEKRPGDVVVISIHWGGNWGYEVPREQREFAHRLVDEGAADVVHGHSSHHPKGIEYYRGHPILYGCGDFINDYEGISGYEEYRSDLVLGYFVTLDRYGALVELEMVPFRTRRFRLERASRHDAAWLAAKLDREGSALSTTVELGAEGSILLGW